MDNIFSGGVNTVNEHNLGGEVYMGPKSTFSILPKQNFVLGEQSCNFWRSYLYVHDVSPLSYCTLFGALAPKEECSFQLPDQNMSNGFNYF